MKIIDRFYKKAQIIPIDDNLLAKAIDRFWETLTDNERGIVIGNFWPMMEETITESFYNVAEEEGENGLKENVYPRIYELYKEEKAKEEGGLDIPALRLEACNTR